MGQPFLAQFVGQPGLLGATDECVAKAPGGLGQQNGGEVRPCSFQDKAKANQEIADDDRQAATIDVGDDASRNLEEKYSRL